MINLQMTNFETLESRQTVISHWTEIEATLKGFILDSDEISIKNGIYFIKRNGQAVGGCVVKQIEKSKTEVYNGDVFYVDLGEGNGTSIQCGIRPALVISNNMCNKFSDIITIIPFTTQNKTKLPTHVVIHPNDYNGLSETSLAMCEQIISISKSQLLNKIGFLKAFEMNKINDSLKTQLNIKEQV